MGARVSKPLGLMMTVLLAALIVGMVAEPGLAGPGRNPSVKIAMHTKAHPTSCTKGYPTFTTCSGINTTWASLGDLDVLPVFYDLVEVTVTEFGLTWPAEWGSMSWVRCKGDGNVGGILNPGDGTAIFWSLCQNSWSLAPGYGWVIATGAGTVSPIPYFATGDYGVVDCQASPGPYYNYPVSTSYAGIGGTAGQDPCFVPTVAPTLSMVDNIGSTSCAFRGNNVIYTLKYKNTNSSGITGVTLVDSLPADVDFVSATGGGIYNSGTGLVTWAIGALAPNDSGTVDLAVTVKTTAPLGGTLVNRARIGCTETTLISTTDVSTHVCACMIDGPILVCPLSSTVFCAPAGTAFIYSWSVTGSGSISGPTNGRCANVTTGSTCNTTYTVHLSVTDGQGIVSECQQEVTVNDTEPPVITSYPQDVAVQCLALVPPVTTRDVHGNDNCSVPTASHVRDDTTGTACNWVINRIYRLTDGCSNFDEEVQHITVQDTVDPEITSCPGNQNVQCITDVPGPDIGLVTATDNCGVVTVAHAGDDTTGTTCNGTVVRTYRATDACNNSTDCVQTFTILDTTDPYFTSACPGDTTVECDEVPPAATMTAADLCDAAVSVTLGEQRTDGRCANVYTLVRTWTAADDCGNDIQCAQTIAVVDTTPPQLVSGPADTPLQCLSDLPAPNIGLVSATDNCGTPVVTWERDDTTGTACNGGVDRTYRVSDACGNYILAYHHFIILDTTNPQFTTACPGNVTVACNAIPTPPAMTASDNCDAVVDIVYDQQRTDGTCPYNYTLQRTWTATDDCGNQAQCRQTITVVDNVAPVFTSHPSDISVQCRSDVPTPSPGSCTATDNCGAVTIEFFSDASDGQTCPEVVTRTYRATDQCDNSSYEVQLITVDDTGAPTLDCQDDKRVACGGPIEFDDPGVSDTCDPSPTLNIVADSAHVNPTNGEVTHTRCWTATDVCGNTSGQCCQNIVEEACAYLPLTITKDDGTTGCVYPGDSFTYTLAYGNPNDAAVSGTVMTDHVPNGADFVAASGGGTYDSGTGNVTWAIGALAGHASDSKTLTVQVQTAVAPGTVLGNDATIVSMETSVANFHLNTPVCPCLITGVGQTCPGASNQFCGPEGMNAYTWTISGDGGLSAPTDQRCVDAVAEDGCNTTYVISLLVEDADGIESECEKTVTVVDATGPVLTCAPDDTVGCTDPIVFTDPTAHDLCAGDITPTVVSTDSASVPGTPNMAHTRCWQAADGCGNVSQCCQTIVREACAFVPLEITKSDDAPVCAVPGGGLRYTLDYRNPNANPVTTVAVVDTLPDDLVVVDTHGGTYRPGPPQSVLWTLGTLPGLGSGSVVLDVEVDPSVAYGSVIHNECWIYCDQAGEGGGMLDTDVCGVGFQSLRLEKDDNIAEPVSPGDTVKYEIRCYNENSLAAHNLTIMDVLPAGTGLAWATSPHTYDAGDHEIIWNLGTLPAGWSLVVNLWVKVAAGAVPGDIVNTARVFCDEMPTPVAASHTTTVERDEVMVYLDVKPGECPNAINPRLIGTMTAAVLGTSDFEVGDIDPGSLRLTREGMAGAVAPQGLSYTDVATPLTGRPCECNALGPDGYGDLVMTFLLSELVPGLDLVSMKGKTVELILTGTLGGPMGHSMTEVPIRGVDCLRVLGRLGPGWQIMLSAGGLGFLSGDQIGLPDGAQVDLSFLMVSSGHVTMDIYDVHGRLIVGMVDSQLDAGNHLVTWDMAGASGRKVPAGIYFVRLSGSVDSVTKKIVVVE